MSKRTDGHYVLTYRNPEDGKTVTLKAKTITDSNLGITFIAVSDFVFENNSPIIDHAVENMRRRLANTRRLHISIHSVISIEEVGQAGKALAFRKNRSNVVVLPTLDTPGK